MKQCKVLSGEWTAAAVVLQLDGIVPAKKSSTWNKWHEGSTKRL